MIKQLFPGDHHNKKMDGFYEIDPLSAGPVLIQNSEKKWLLVDPGAFSHKGLLLAELAFHGLVPADIDAVLITHHHLDHVSNNFMFHDYCPIFTRSAILWPKGKATICVDSDVHKADWPADIEMIQTPGHTDDHVSYVYREGDVTYVCAGDAVREDIIRGEEGVSAHQEKDFLNSSKIIFEIGDVIFPGHGRVIDGDLFKELKKIVDAKS